MKIIIKKHLIRADMNKTRDTRAAHWADGGSETTVVETTTTCLFCRCNTWASKNKLATNTKQPGSTLQYSGALIFVSAHYCHSNRPHHDVTHKQKLCILQSWPVFFLLWLGPYQLACQLLPPFPFINIVSLFIQRGQGSATMTTVASIDCRPPIHTSDTCVFTKWETSTVCSQ